ncbi:MAG: signal peptidase II [Clostridia bacterium]|nr:signal peptidase II [Clostridia bacterium]
MSNGKNYKYSIWGWTFLSLFLVFLDQITKLLVVKNLDLAEYKWVINGFFSIFYVRNTGVAFSMFEKLSNGPYVLAVVAVLLACAVFYVLFKISKKGYLIECFCLSLILGGALGNIIDRIRLKYVVDFLRFDFGPRYTFPIFNFADICAVVGCFLFIFLCIVKSKEIDEIWDMFTLKKTVAPVEKQEKNDEN